MMAQSKTGVIEHTMLLNMVDITITVYACAFKFLFFNFTSWRTFFPCRWWQLPYYWFGIKLYDLVAGSQCLKSSYVLSKSRALEHFPMLRKDELVGAIVYYDGMLPFCAFIITLCCVLRGEKHKYDTVDHIHWLSKGKNNNLEGFNLHLKH